MRRLYPYLTSSLYVLSVGFLLTTTATAQTNGDYRTRANGNWSATNVWQIYNSGWSNTITAPTSSNGTITISHNITVTANATASNVILSSNTITLNNSVTLGITGNLTINGGSLKNSSSSFGVISSTLNIGGSLTLNNSGSLFNESDAISSATLNIDLKGNFVMNNSSVITTNPGWLAAATLNFNFSGTAVQAFTKTGGTISSTVNFSVANGSAIDFSSSILNGSDGYFTLNDGAKIIIGLSTNPVQVNGTRTFSSNADYEFKTSSIPVFTTTPTANTARDIIINNTSGNVVLPQPMTVSRELKLQNGELQTTSTNIITLNDNAIVSGYSNISFINGPVIKKGNDDFTFPVGRTGAGLIPIRISGLSGSSDFRAEYKRLPAPSGTSITASGLKRVSHCEYWTLDRTGSATANVTLYWNPQSNCNVASYVTELSTIVVAHFNGTNWDAYGRSGGTTGTVSSGSVTWNGVSSFSPFSLGSTSPTQNPLPVLLTNVIAYEKNNGVQVEWTNMTESNIDNYSIQRSSNGVDFIPIAKQQPKSNTSDRADYTQLDAAPMSLNYYRILATEANGKTISSRIMKVEKGKTNNSLLIYPNPVTSKQLNINVTNIKTGQYKLKVFNSAGFEVFTKTILSRGTVIADAIKLTQLQDGTYTILLTGDNYSQSRLFIVQ